MQHLHEAEQNKSEVDNHTHTVCILCANGGFKIEMCTEFIFSFVVFAAGTLKVSLAKSQVYLSINTAVALVVLKRQL